MTIRQLEKAMMETLRPETLVMCRFYDGNGRMIRWDWVELSKCAKEARYVAGCRSWQPFVAMHGAVETIID